MRILMVEDVGVLRDGLVMGLSLAGFTSEAVATLAEGKAAHKAGGFSGVVLDLMLPDGSGLDLLARFRARGPTLPVLMLTARDRPHERVAGSDSGADDFVGKPFDLEELYARLRAVRRRAEGRADACIAWNRRHHHDVLLGVYAAHPAADGTAAPIDEAPIWARRLAAVPARQNAGIARNWFDRQTWSADEIRSRDCIHPATCPRS